MQLKTVDGKLTLGSVYKLFDWRWLLSWSVLFGVVLLISLLVGVTTGQMAVNGETVHGAGPVLAALLPMTILFPVVIVFHAFIFGGLLTFGVWLYRLRRPLEVIAAESA